MGVRDEIKSALHFNFTDGQASDIVRAIEVIVEARVTALEKGEEETEKGTTDGWLGVMIPIDETGGTRLVPGWKCRSCGRLFGTDGPPPSGHGSECSPASPEEKGEEEMEKGEVRKKTRCWHDLGIVCCNLLKGHSEKHSYDGTRDEPPASPDGIYSTPIPAEAMQGKTVDWSKVPASPEAPPPARGEDDEYDGAAYGVGVAGVISNMSATLRSLVDDGSVHVRVVQGWRDALEAAIRDEPPGRTEAGDLLAEAVAEAQTETDGRIRPEISKALAAYRAAPPARVGDLEALVGLCRDLLLHSDRMKGKCGDLPLRDCGLIFDIKKALAPFEKAGKESS